MLDKKKKKEKHLQSLQTSRFPENGQEKTSY